MRLDRLSPIPMIALLALALPTVGAGQGVIQSLLDLDADPTTGCTVPTSDGDFAGVEAIVSTRVDKAAGLVGPVTLEECTGAVFGPAVEIDPGSWAVGLGLGTGGSDVVETLLPLSMVSFRSMARVGFVSCTSVDPTPCADHTGSADALLTDTGDQGGASMFIASEMFREVPTLGRWGLAFLVLLLFIAAARALGGRRVARPTLLAVICVLTLAGAVVWAAIVLDGDPADWDGTPPLGTDPIGDAPGMDLVAGFARGEAGNLFLRHDAFTDTAPTAVEDTATVSEDDPATPMDILANDTDPDGGPKAVATATDPAHGTVLVTGGGTGLTYQPDPDYCNNPPGSTLDTFQYTLSPGGSSATVSLTVQCVNDPPAGTDGTVTTPHDTPYVFAPSDFGFTDPIDPVPDTLQAVRVTTLPAAGTLTLSGGAVTSGQLILASGIDDGNLEFTPAIGGFGDPYTSFTFQVQDDGGTANGGVDLDPSPNMLSIVVLAVPCGNGDLDSGEVCDGSNLGGFQCTDAGLPGGTASCAADCSAFDLSTCNEPTGYGNCAAFPENDVCMASEVCVSDDSTPTVSVCLQTPCTSASECGPAPASGTASVSCQDVTGDQIGDCFLSCMGGETCPDGMTCLMGWVCVWPVPS